MTARIESTPIHRSAAGPLRRLLWVSPLAMLVASVANLALYAAAGRLFPEVTAWPGAGPGQIVGANIVYLLVGAIALAAIARFSSHPARHFQIGATVGLLLSLGLPVSAGFGYGPPGTPPAGMATVVTLSLMHVISYAISVPLFLRLALGKRS